MAEKIEGWVDTCERFVAFLDIMGFKDRLHREGHEEVGEKLELLRNTLDSIDARTKTKQMIESINDAIHGIGISEENREIYALPSSLVFPMTFSDSIILVSRDDSKASVLDMFFNVGFILARAIAMGVPMKGAIALGKMTSDRNKSLYYGQPLIDSYELHNEIQLCGVVLHHTCEKRLSQLKILHLFEDDGIFKYLVPMKSGKITYYLIDWTAHYKNEQGLVGLVSNLYHSVSGEPRKYVDNTLEFVRWVIARRQEIEENTFKEKLV